MAKNSPIETRTSRVAYCSKSLLPCSANWTNRFQSISCPSIGGCAATSRYVNREHYPRRCSPLSVRCENVVLFQHDCMAREAAIDNAGRIGLELVGRGI